MNFVKDQFRTDIREYFSHREWSMYGITCQDRKHWGFQDQA